jgi:SAM-dependent methyltransferase
MGMAGGARERDGRLPWRGAFDGARYQARFDALAAEGKDVHGEAQLVASLGPATVLDAGCGTGRVAIELARRGIAVVGVDVDASMIAEARRRAPGLEWIEADVARLALDRHFDVVVMAGNVPLFCPADGRSALVAACARHLAPDGTLVSGFQLDGDYPLARYDADCAAAGLVLAERYATWEGDPWEPGAAYAVSLHRPQEHARA